MNDLAPSTVKAQNLLDPIMKAKDAKTLESAVSAFANEIFNFDKKSTILKNIQDLVKKNRKDKTTRSKIVSELQKYSRICAVDSGLYAAVSLHSGDETHAISLRNNLMQEYGVSTSSEKMIVDMAVTAYFRHLNLTSAYSKILSPDEHSITFRDQAGINELKEIGKQADIAFRQILTAITFLKELRRPPLSVRVQTKQAFIGQNQQFNALNRT